MEGESPGGRPNSFRISGLARIRFTEYSQNSHRIVTEQSRKDLILEIIINLIGGQNYESATE
jgi:hypothetical protein